MLSPLDWALIEAWKNSGVPLEAVLRGIDKAFEKWRGGKKRTQSINSVAYCTQAVIGEAQNMARAATGQPAATPSAPFTLEELQSFLDLNVKHLSQFQDSAYGEIVVSLTRLSDDVQNQYGNLEELERHLSALEQRMIATAHSRQTDDDLIAARRELDIQLKPYRGRMSVEQISMLERQFLDRRIMENAGLRRLSLFYLGM